MSCSQPNLQQVPRDKPYRSRFRAPDGTCLVRADLSLVELCVAADLAGDDRMTQALEAGDDLQGFRRVGPETRRDVCGAISNRSTRCAAHRRQHQIPVDTCFDDEHGGPATHQGASHRERPPTLCRRRLPRRRADTPGRPPSASAVSPHREDWRARPRRYIDTGSDISHDDVREDRRSTNHDSME